MNIKCTQNIYKSANGVSNVAYYILVPEDSHIRGIVQISHGMCEYFSRYTAFAKYLCGLGFIVCGNDHIGHGASVSRPADLGFFAAHDGWKYLIQDVLHLRELMHRRYPDLPYFMLGHSMGSLIVRLCLPECGTELAGSILIGTAGPNAAALSAAHIADSIARTRGVTFRSGLLNGIAFKAYNRRIDHRIRSLTGSAATKRSFLSISRTKSATLSSPPPPSAICSSSARARTATRPSAAPRTTCRCSSSQATATRSAATATVCAASSVFIVQAAPATSTQFFTKNARHELLNELGRIETYGDISRWLEERLAEQTETAPAETQKA